MEGLGWAHFGLGTALSTPPLRSELDKAIPVPFSRKEGSILLAFWP